MAEVIKVVCGSIGVVCFTP
nr:DUF3265 domain-containing protein [Vibrio alginolyticus]